MERHTFMLTKHSKQAEMKRKENILHKARREVDINGGGTSGYVVKSGPNTGKILKHISVKHQNQ